ncbi:hypothetical protein C4J81_04450 [Deltaproteobacteria bacterium Smac51]|nr:hypothetical protein C4J81_04450 [Deltaproteobacteria bacterium Smac51]
MGNSWGPPPGEIFLPGSVPEVLVTEPGKNISPGGCLVGFLQGWKARLAEWEPEAGACFWSGSVTKDPRNGAGPKTSPGFRRVSGFVASLKADANSC